MFERIVGVFKLDAATFEAIEHDRSATGQAALVVLIAAFVSGAGSVIGASIAGQGAAGGFFSTLVSVFAGWVIWSFLTYFIGTRFFGGQADLGEMLRVIGFAYAPQVLGIVPCLGSLVGAIWSLAAAFVGIRQGLDLSNGKTFLTVIVGFVVYLAVSLLLGMLLGGGGGLFEQFTT